MKTATIILSILLFCGSAAFAQQKKSAKKQALKPAKSQPSKTTLASSFYKTPYATRNSGSFDGSSHLISLSYGIPNTIDYTGFLYGNSGSSIGPASIRYEFPIRDEAGVGLSVSGATKKYSYFGGSETKVSGIAISPFGFYHFNKLIPMAKFDVYAGIGASVNLLNYTYEGTDEKESDVEVEPAGIVGARYYFTHSFSAMAEVGEGSFSIFRIGLSFRL